MGFSMADADADIQRADRVNNSLLFLLASRNNKLFTNEKQKQKQKCLLSLFAEVNALCALLIVLNEMSTSYLNSEKKVTLKSK